MLTANADVPADLGAELCARETLEGDALAALLDRLVGDDDASDDHLATVSQLPA